MANDGKVSEGHVQEALKEMERRYKSTWVRLYDSKSAGLGSGGNIIPPQPSDFIVATPNRVATLEVKSSEMVASLVDTNLRAMFKENQILGARLWMRAGHGAICVFHSLVSNRFEIWSMKPVVEAYLAPPRKRKLEAAPLTTCKAVGLADTLYSVL